MLKSHVFVVDVVDVVDVVAFALLLHYYPLVSLSLLMDSKIYSPKSVNFTMLLRKL
jgi:hypothetical protein